MRTSKLLLLAASVSALSVSTPGFAFQADGQEPATQDAATDDRPQSGGVEDIVVTARRVSESVQQVPLAITVVGTEPLTDSSVRGIKALQGLDRKRTRLKASNYCAARMPYSGA